MRISFSPIRSNERYQAAVSGDTLTIDGEVFDFSPLPEGATLTGGAVDCLWITGEAARIDGEICVTLILPHGPLNGQHFTPAAITTTEGPVALPEPEKEPVA